MRRIRKGKVFILGALLFIMITSLFLAWIFLDSKIVEVYADDSIIGSTQNLN